MDVNVKLLDFVYLSLFLYIKLKVIGQLPMSPILSMLTANFNQLLIW